jgi:hypothetical protein
MFFSESFSELPQPVLTRWASLTALANVLCALALRVVMNARLSTMRCGGRGADVLAPLDSKSLSLCQRTHALRSIAHHISKPHGLSEAEAEEIL